MARPVPVRSRPLLLLAGLTFVAFLVVASQAWGNSGGAPPGSAQDGCNCHSANPSNTVKLTLDGLPVTFASNSTYNLTLTVEGRAALPAPVGRNQGGFAVEADAGTLVITDADTMQLRGAMLTHTAAGNDQRMWNFQWASPANASTNVTFSIAGNAVNGDGLNNAQDEWNLGTVTVGVPAVNNTTTPTPTPTPDDKGIPGLGLPASGAAAALAVAVLARRRP